MSELEDESSTNQNIGTGMEGGLISPQTNTPGTSHIEPTPTPTADRGNNQIEHITEQIDRLSRVTNHMMNRLQEIQTGISAQNAPNPQPLFGRPSGHIGPNTPIPTQPTQTLHERVTRQQSAENSSIDNPTSGLDRQADAANLARVQQQLNQSGAFQSNLPPQGGATPASEYGTKPYGQHFHRGQFGQQIPSENQPSNSSFSQIDQEWGDHGVTHEWKTLLQEELKMSNDSRISAYLVCNQHITIGEYYVGTGNNVLSLKRVLNRSEEHTV